MLSKFSRLRLAGRFRGHWTVLDPAEDLGSELARINHKAIAGVCSARRPPSERRQAHDQQQCTKPLGKGRKRRIPLFKDPEHTPLAHSSISFRVFLPRLRLLGDGCLPPFSR